jgi:hypothetical protein
MGLPGGEGTGRIGINYGSKALGPCIWFTFLNGQTKKKLTFSSRRPTNSPAPENIDSDNPLRNELHALLCPRMTTPARSAEMDVLTWVCCTLDVGWDGCLGLIPTLVFNPSVCIRIQRMIMNERSPDEKL